MFVGIFLKRQIHKIVT